MLLRTFTAPSSAEAIAQARETLGADAVIVSTRSAKGGGVELIVAAEFPDPAGVVAEPGSVPAEAEQSDPVPIRRARPRAGSTPGWEKRGPAEALNFHGVPRRLADELVRLAQGLDAGDAVGGLAAALEARFRFAPVPARPARPIMLAGPCGVGKSVTAAKLASRAVLAGHTVELITTDIARAGAREQLAHFADLLDCPLVPAGDADALTRALAGPIAGVRIVDTGGINPLDPDDLADLRSMAHAADIDLALVLAAGGDPYEAAETADAFVRLGARRLIATRIDASRRLGSLLAAADAGLAIAQVGITPYVARGLTPLDPYALARLLLEDPAARPSFDALQEAAE